MTGHVASAIKHIGLTKLGNRLNLWASAVQKWRDDDCLPQTELSGLTNYAAVIAEMAEEARIAKRLKCEKFTAEKLIETTREQWERRRAQTPRKRRA